MSRIERLVAVFNPDGSLKAAALTEIETVNGKDYYLDPRPLNVSDAAAIASLMGETQTAALAANAALQATVAERDATIAGHAAVIQERDALQARVAELEAQLAVSQADDLPAAIRAERDRRILAGVKVGDDWYHTGMQDQIQYLGLMMMGANIPPGTPLKTMAGVNVGATQQRVQAIFASAAQQMATLHAIADAAIAAQTPLDQIQWPESYSPA